MTSAFLLVVLAAGSAWSGPGGPSLPAEIRERAEALPAPPSPSYEASASSGASVVFVTLDGVRWQEFFGNKPDPLLSATDSAPTFPRFWSTLAGRGVVLGGPQGSSMTVSNLAMLSLPAYQSMMAASMTSCFDNDCGRIKTETLPERLVREGFSKGEVVTIGGWEKIAFAAESLAGATTVDAGPQGPGETGPSAGCRWDATTWAKGLAALKTRPRWLWIALNDADDYGHADKYPEYLASLRRYDQWLADLVGILDAMGDWGERATLIVTTDHGRGDGKDWTSHGGRFSAAPVWLYARGPSVPPTGVLPPGGAYGHADLRPTIERLYGLAPKACRSCGSPIKAVVP